ncbi:MAG: cysteine desulfurase [bacterium]
MFKKDFPIFANHPELAYLDSAATAQMPKVVIDAVTDFNLKTRANVHRGIYKLSEEATALYEGARETVREFINARDAREIIFTKNTTDSINLVAHSLASTILKPGDHVLVSIAEHHSNFLPWQSLLKQGIVFDVVDVDNNGLLPAIAVEQSLTPQTRLVAISHVSNALGVIQPIEEIGKMLKEKGIMFLVDSAQSVAHLPGGVQAIPCDFLAFSGHKMGGPMGIGALYGRKELLEQMEPVTLGGGMITSVTKKEAIWQEIPWKFEAGTPNVEGAIGLAAAIGYINGIGYEKIRKLDEELVRAVITALENIPGVIVYGPKDIVKRSGIVSFNVEGIHPHDLASIVDREGIAIRAGHHCAMPLMKRLGVNATVRASFWVYNEVSEVERLAVGIRKAIKLLRP